MAASPPSVETTPSPERVQAGQGTHSAEHARSTSRAGASRSSRVVLICLGMLCVLLFINWLVAIGRFQPNVLFSDQWDFFVPLFDGAGLWPQFNRQHGPV